MYMATAAELIAEAEAATTAEELDAIEGQAEERITVLRAVSDARARLVAPSLMEEEPSLTHDGHVRDPDFVWVGCSTCWTPRDATRQVRAYQEWLADGHRYLTYNCVGCTERQGHYVEVHPSLFAFWLEEAVMWHEGGPAALATEVKRWGN
jgi:hypothetical protein